MNSLLPVITHQCVVESRLHSINMDSTKFEARPNIKFTVKLGRENRQIIDVLEQDYGDNASKTSTTFKWIIRFRSGRNENENEHRSVRPGKSVCQENVDAVRNMTEKCSRITTESDPDILINFGSVHTILVESLGVKESFCTMVP